VGTGTLVARFAAAHSIRGNQVRCMVRSPRKLRFLQEWGCELTRGRTASSLPSLDNALEGQDRGHATRQPRAPTPSHLHESIGSAKLI